MSMIKMPIKFEGSLGAAMVETLVDVGVTFSCISSKLADSLEVSTKMKRALEANSSSKDAIVKIKKKVVLDFYYNDVRMSDEFLVVPGLSEEVILGGTTLQKWRIKIDFGKDTIVVDPKATKISLP